MKLFRPILPLLLALATTAPALPLQTGLVPENAKWLVHLDLDNFRDSKLGNLVLKEMLAAHLAQLKAAANVDVELILQKLHSLTAYGTDFQAGPQANGVLLLSGEEETRQILEGFLSAQILQNPDGPIKKQQQDPFVLYSLHNEIFVAPNLAGQVVVSKSRAQVEEAKKLLAAKDKPHSNQAFSGYASVPNSFFFLAVAEGFNENAALPPQAKILKQAEGARIVLGEKADLIFLNLALKAKDPEVLQQIRQVLEGMKALVALGQSENKDLLDLVQSTQVASTEKMVTVNLEYPFAKAAGKLDEFSKHLQKGSDAPHHAKRDKRKSNKSAQPQPAPSGADE